MILINKFASPSNRSPSESSDIEAITCATDVDFSLRGPWSKECTRSRLTMDVNQLKVQGTKRREIRKPARELESLGQHGACSCQDTLV